MSPFADGPKTRTGPELRALLEALLTAESEPLTRLQALHVAAQVCKAAEEVLTQRVIEARSFYRSWTQIAEAVGVTKQSANRRWRALDAAAEALAADRERQYRPRAQDAHEPAEWAVPKPAPEYGAWWPPPDAGALPSAVPSEPVPADDGWDGGCGCDDDP